MLNTASFFSGKSEVKRRMSSSVKEDFPAPPVPVMPTTGTVRSTRLSKISWIALASFSAKLIALARAPNCCGFSGDNSCRLGGLSKTE